MRREGDREAIVRLLLDFSGLLERDWCRDRRDDPRGNGAHENGNPVGGGVEAGGEAGVGMGTAGRRIESMGVVLEQLAPLVDWNSEVKAVEKNACLISAVSLFVRPTTTNQQFTPSTNAHRLAAFTNTVLRKFLATAICYISCCSRTWYQVPREEFGRERKAFWWVVGLACFLLLSIFPRLSVVVGCCALCSATSCCLDLFSLCCRVLLQVLSLAHQPRKRLASWTLSETPL